MPTDFWPWTLPPPCPQPAKVGKVSMKNKFRTWAAVRFNGDDGCIKTLHHVDWVLNWDVRRTSDSTDLEKAGVVDAGDYNVTAVVDEQSTPAGRIRPRIGGPFPNVAVTKKLC